MPWRLPPSHWVSALLAFLAQRHIFFSVCLERFLALLTSFERRLRSGSWRDDRRWPRGPSAAATTCCKCTASVARAAFQSEDEKWLLKLDASGRKNVPSVALLWPYSATSLKWHQKRERLHGSKYLLSTGVGMNLNIAKVIYEPFHRDTGSSSC